jgi:hypothetical protein
MPKVQVQTVEAARCLVIQESGEILMFAQAVTEQLVTMTLVNVTTTVPEERITALILAIVG